MIWFRFYILIFIMVMTTILNASTSWNDDNTQKPSDKINQNSYFQLARDTMFTDLEAFCSFVKLGLQQYSPADQTIEKRQGLAYWSLCLSYDDQYAKSNLLADSLLMCQPVDHLTSAYALAAKGGSAQFQNQHQKAVDFYIQSIASAEAGKHSVELGLLNNALAYLFYELEYYEKGIQYALKTEKIGNELNNKQLLARAWHRLDECHFSLNNGIDSKASIKYQAKFDSITKIMNNPSLILSALMNKAWIFRDKEIFDSAVHYYTRALSLAQQSKDSHEMALIFGNLGAISLDQMGRTPDYEAFTKLPQLLPKVENENNALFILFQLSRYHAKIEDHKTAYRWMMEYIDRDEAFYDEKTRTEMLDSEAKYNQLQQQKEIIEQELEIKKKTSQRNLILGMSFALITLGMLSFALYKDRLRKKEYHQDQLLWQTETDLLASRMQMMRAQMNPHFLFNSLNSIKHFILLKSKDESAQYISDFSKLMRLNLQNSAEMLIPLERELIFLKQYILMEQMRFKKAFETNWHINENIHLDDYHFPPMLIQPYIENAIWHGLRYKKDNRKIDIYLNVISESSISCIIQDNGVGRQKSQEIQEKSISLKKSMGTKITADRIDMINRILDVDIQVQIEDLYADDGTALGTRVHVLIPKIEADLF